jgi:hypothetical protein
MSANELLTVVAQMAMDLLNPDTWRIVLLILVAWGVLLLVQIRRLLTRLVEEVQFRPSSPEREERVLRDEIPMS